MKLYTGFWKLLHETLKSTTLVYPGLFENLSLASSIKETSMTTSQDSSEAVLLMTHRNTYWRISATKWTQTSSKTVLSTNRSRMHPTLLDGGIISIESASQKAWEVFTYLDFFSFSVYKLCYYFMSFFFYQSQRWKALALLWEHWQLQNVKPRVCPTRASHQPHMNNW